MEKKEIEAVLNKSVKNAFPGQIKKIVVSEDDLGFKIYHNVFIVLYRYEDLEIEPKVMELLDLIEKVFLTPVGIEIDHVVMAMED
jgi:hypothetical protein